MTLAVNPALQDWTQGAVSVTNGSQAVSFAGAGLVSTDPTTGATLAVCARGDLLCVGTVTALIASVTDANDITLFSPWEGSTQAGAAYSITRYTRPSTGTLAAAIQTMLSQGSAANPDASLVIDDGTARIAIENVAGVPTLAVGPTGTAVGSLAAAIQATTGGVISHPNGLIFGQSPARRNRIINGQFDIWQRGTSISLPAGVAVYTADRTIIYNGLSGTATVSKVAVPSGFRGQYALNYQGTGATAGQFIGIYQRIESQLVSDLDSQPCMISFDINASTTAGTLTGTLQVLANTALDNGTYSTSMFYQVFTIPVGSGKISIPIAASALAGLKYGGQATIIIGQNGATGNMNVTVGSLQFEPGTVAQPFEKYAVGAELALCQRYYETSYTNNVAPGTVVGISSYSHGLDATQSFGSIQCPFKVEKRATPTVTIYSPNSGTAAKIYNSNATVDVAGAVNSVDTNGFLATVSNVSVATPNLISVSWAASAEL